MTNKPKKDNRKAIKPQPAELAFKPFPVYSDENFVVLRVSPIADLNQKMQIPYQIAQIGVYGITAKEFVPRVGKLNFKKSVDTLIFALTKWLEDEKENADKPLSVADAIKAGDETKQ
jgi:hypothetical protein